MSKSISKKTAYILTHSHKDGMIRFMKKHPENFKEIMQIALSENQPYSWRSAWLLWSCIEKNDVRLKNYSKKIIKVLPNLKHSQQRELLKTLQVIPIEENDKGTLFNICIDIWCNHQLQPSVRINALKIMVNIAKEHPDLFNEITALCTGQYIEGLSAAVMNVIKRLLHKKQSR